MEALFEYLPIILFAIYALLRNRKAAQKKRQQAQTTANPQAVAEGRESKPSQLQEFLRQIEEAVAEANNEAPKPEPRLQPEPTLKLSMEESIAQTRKRLQSTPRASASFASTLPSDEFHEVEGAGFDHDKHGFGSANPYSESVFEQVKPHAVRAAPPADRLSFNPHKRPDTPLALPEAPAPRRAAVLAERLRHPDAARDAIVLNAIFERPHASPRGSRR